MSTGSLFGRCLAAIRRAWKRIDRSSTFWPTVLMAIILAGCKVEHFGLPQHVYRTYLSDYATNLAIAIHQDLVYALVLGLIGQGVLLLVRRWPRVQSSLWIGFVFFCLINVLYGIISVQVFWFLRMPLTYPLIYLAGDVKNMQSSVGAFMTPLLALVLIGIPLLYLLGAVLVSQLRLPATKTIRLSKAGGLLVLLVFVLLSRHAARGQWNDEHDDRRIADSPHYIMIASCFQEAFGSRSIQVHESFPAEYSQDFLLVSERPDGGRPTPDLRRGPRNVIVIVLESVATQQLHLYGSPYQTTPRLEAEAANCLVFDNFYSHFTNTANALAAMLLSVYPPMTWRELTVENPSMPGQTVPRLLKPLGYRTAFISAGDNRFANQDNFLKNRGFDILWDCENSGHPRDFSWGVEDRYMIDMILRWIDSDPAKPFFIFSWTQGTHNPYLEPAGEKEIVFLSQSSFRPPNADIAGWKITRYLNAIHEADRQIGRLFDALRDRKLADDTIVLVVGDHGEVFGYPHPNWGHTGKVFQEDVNVPFILWNPRIFSPGMRIKKIGAQIDVSPTIMDLLGIPLAPTWQGRSLFDQSRPPRAYFYGAMEDMLLGIRQWDHKYILNITQGRESLYDLAADPQEQTNIAAKKPELCHGLRQRLAAWVNYEKNHVR